MMQEEKLVTIDVSLVFLSGDPQAFLEGDTLGL